MACFRGVSVAPWSLDSTPDFCECVSALTALLFTQNIHFILILFIYLFIFLEGGCCSVVSFWKLYLFEYDKINQFLKLNFTDLKNFIRKSCQYKGKSFHVFHRYNFKKIIMFLCLPSSLPLIFLLSSLF